VPAGTLNKSVHAEVCVLQKLPYIKRGITINIISLRFNSKSELLNGKPCQDCIHYMNTTARKKGYNINKVYYSNDSGAIICAKLSHLLKDDNCVCIFKKRKLQSK